MKKEPKKEHDLVQAAREMLAYERGEISLNTRIVHVPEKVHIVSIRKRLGYTQKKFAEHFGFALSALKDWEQGRRKPERAARILLAIISARPEFVEETLAKISE